MASAVLGFVAFFAPNWAKFIWQFILPLQINNTIVYTFVSLYFYQLYYLCTLEVRFCRSGGAVANNALVSRIPLPAQHRKSDIFMSSTSRHSCPWQSPLQLPKLLAEEAPGPPQPLTGQDVLTFISTASFPAVIPFLPLWSIPFPWRGVPV